MMRLLGLLALPFCIASAAWAQEAPLLTPDPAGVAAIATQASEGQAIVTMPVRHGRVGRLQNDILGTGIVNSDRVVVPRGTPVYAAAFTEMRGGDTTGHLEGWCGVVIERGRERGYCMFPRGRGAVLGVLPSNGSLYAPTRLADYSLRPITVPQVELNDAAYEALPDIELQIAFVEWDADDLDLRQRIVVNGATFDVGALPVTRRGDGSAVLSVQGIRLRLTPSSDETMALIERIAE